MAATSSTGASGSPLAAIAPATPAKPVNLPITAWMNTRHSSTRAMRFSNEGWLRSWFMGAWDLLGAF